MTPGPFDGAALRRAAVALILAAVVARAEVSVRWEDLRELTRDAQVEIVAPARVVKGRVRAIDRAHIMVGRERVPRAAVSRVKILRYVGPWRKAGRNIGFVVGMVAGIVAYVAIGLDETRGDSKQTRQVKAVSAWLGTWVGVTIGGWLLGRLADKEITEVLVIPEAPGDESSPCSDVKDASRDPSCLVARARRMDRAVRWPLHR